MRRAPLVRILTVDMSTLSSRETLVSIAEHGWVFPIRTLPRQVGTPMVVRRVMVFLAAVENAMIIDRVIAGGAVLVDFYTLTNEDVDSSRLE